MQKPLVLSAAFLKNSLFIFPRETAKWQGVLKYGSMRAGLKNGKMMNNGTKKSRENKLQRWREQL